MKIQKAFTLLELLIVVVIIGILTILFLPAFKQAREAALNDEARANLKLIQAAEDAFHMDRGTYYYSDSETDLNTNLRLSLQNATNLRWDYRVDLVAGGGSVADKYIINAIRTTAVAGSGYDRVIWINRTMNEAECSGSFCK